MKEVSSIDNNKVSINNNKKISSNTLKNSLIGIGVIVGASTLALGVYTAYQKFKGKKQDKINQNDISKGFNTSLNNYIKAIKEKNLSLDIVEDLLWNINFLKENLENKEIKITISVNQLEELVNLIYNYTLNLAKVNNINSKEVEKKSNDLLLNIIYYLYFQKEIFQREIV